MSHGNNSGRYDRNRYFDRHNFVSGTLFDLLWTLKSLQDFLRGGENLLDAVKTAVSAAATDTMAMFTEVLPIALGVFAASWGVRKAIRFFKGAAN